MQINKILFFILFVLLLVGCSSSKGTDLSPEPTRKVMKNIPDWYKNKPKKNGYRYAGATATSRDLQLAVNKATLDAANQLAGAMDSEMNALVKRAREETGISTESDILDRFSQTQEQIISTALKDYSVIKQEIMEEKSNNRDIFRAYILVEWDEGAAQKRLLDRIKADKEIYDAIRASELYEEMEQKVEEYRKRKGM
ncbi:MAG: hypothetical protein CMG69_00730 [Candidatus Marinimicrobia bacterium]|nr:hypothetical protein [Candidatus Neomarinimicrobiota bacterium]|tara:strand:- start:36800 stop:37390 length:591 start_codon:yes stop_codon:yes gene_type:complete